MGKRAGGKDFAPRVRSLVDRVIEKLEVNGDAEELLLNQFKEDFAGTLNKMSSYAPKQIQAEVTTRTIEDFVISAVTEQTLDDSTEEAKLH